MRRIGIVGSSTGENSFGTGKTYLNYISKHLEAIPVILCPSDTIDPALELVIMPGGMDVSPRMYASVPDYYTSHTDVFKQHFADVNLAQYIEAHIPIMGICLGHQTLAVYFGSDLSQNVPDHMSEKRGEENHKVKLTDVGKGLTQRGKGEMGVNSHHHQAIFTDGLSDQLTPLALAPDPFVMKDQEWNDPIVEAFIHKTLPVGGCQWHPEEWADPLSIALANKLIEKGIVARKAAPKLKLS
jgi:putative glutamine amidotransferase